METCEVTELTVLGKNVIRVYFPRGWVLYSYGTPVALAFWGKARMCVETYSATTKKHITQYGLDAVQVSPKDFLRTLKSLFKS